MHRANGCSLRHEDAAGYDAANTMQFASESTSSLSMKAKTHKSRRLKRDPTRMRRALLGIETLEGRLLMAGDLVSLAPDTLYAIQDQTSQILNVLGNDRFDTA